MPTAAMAATLSKMEIIGLLARRHEFTRYLELCTPTTGCEYARLDRQILTAPCRLMYNCPADFEDGLGIDFRSETFDYSPCLAEMHRQNLRYDIILIESFHEYDFSYRDLKIAFDLLEADGIIVAHDCLPPTAAMATPHFIPGCWCGVSYKAYLDFVLALRLDYYTVDTDYGCGIISKPDRLSHLAKRLQTYANVVFDHLPQQGFERQRSRALWREWRGVGRDFDRAFSLLETQKDELLNLVSPEEFLARFSKIDGLRLEIK